jgi:hypothetical protein
MPICEQPPFEMVFRYNGGDCSGGYNVQPDTFYQCQDFGVGPPRQASAISYIIAFERGGGEEYFSAFVGVNEEFKLLAEEKFSANMNITVYDPGNSTDVAEILRPDNMIQTVIYHSSCSQNLFLKDRFGSVQLVEFTNVDQGRVSCFQNVSLIVSVDIPVTVDGVAELTALTIVTNQGQADQGIFDLSELVAGKSLTPGQPCQFQESFAIDLTSRRRLTALTTVVGRTNQGQGCFGTDFYEFEVGNPLPPIFPTIAPTLAPTVSPFPTPDPETTPCNLQAEISCRQADGASCLGLKSPTNSRCIGDQASLLQFIYIPSSLCNGNNTQNRFRCEDSNVDISPRPSTVYVTISRRNTLFEGVVDEGTILTLETGGEPEVEIAISTVDNGGPGSLLQSSRMSTKCNAEEGLTLLNTFGHLHLVGFQNTQMDLQQVFANIELEYTASNEGRLRADMTGAFSDSPFSGFQTLLPSGQRISLRPNGGFTSFSEAFKVDLTSGVDAYDFTFLINGEGTVSAEPCQATADFTLRVD